MIPVFCDDFGETCPVRGIPVLVCGEISIAGAGVGTRGSYLTRIR